MKVTLSGTEVEGTQTEVNQVLACLARSGRTDAADELLRANDPLISVLVTKYTSLDSRSSWWDDLMQEARLGVMDAVVKYDPERGKKFFTYAQHWVRKKVQKFLALTGPVKVPQNAFWRAKKENRIDEDGNEVPNVDEEGSVVLTRARAAARSSCRTRGFLDMADDFDLMRNIEDREFARFAVEVVSQHRDPRVCYIVEEFYGTTGRKARTLQSIGDDLGITKERVRQLRDKGLDMVRELL